MTLLYYSSYKKKLLAYLLLGILVHIIFFFLITYDFAFDTRYESLSPTENLVALPIILAQPPKVIQPKIQVIERPNETIEIIEKKIEEEEEEEEEEKEPIIEESVDIADTQEDATATQQEVYASFYSVDKRPSFVSEAVLLYPLVERKQGKEGIVILIIKIDKTGTLRDVRVTKSAGESFDAAAVNKIKQSSFSPGYKKSTPVNTEMRIKIVFKLK